MNPIEKRKQDLNQDLYVDLIHQWKAQRPRRVRDNMVRFSAPVPTSRQEESVPDGLTTGGAVAILLTLLVLTAVLTTLGMAP